MSTIRTPAKASQGLSYFDANKQRLITIEDDVLGIKKRILETWPQLNVYFDEWDLEWVITESCDDREERFVLATKALDERVMDRLRRADGSSGIDFLHEIEKEEEQLKKDQMNKTLDAIGDAAERLQLAMHKDGITNRPKIFVGEQYESLRDANRS